MIVVLRYHHHHIIIIEFIVRLLQGGHGHKCITLVNSKKQSDTVDRPIGTNSYKNYSSGREVISDAMFYMYIIILGKKTAIRAICYCSPWRLTSR